MSNVYLYNDRIYETYDDATTACAEDGHYGSSSKDWITELPFRGRTYQDGFTAGKLEGAKEKAAEILYLAEKLSVTTSILECVTAQYINMVTLRRLCQPSEEEREKE